MKKTLLLLGLIGVMLISGIAYASSNTTNAKYLTTVQIANSSASAQSNKVAVFTLNTTSMISANMLDASALEAAMLTGSGGTDIAFSPIYGTANWTTFVSSISGGGNLNQYLYTKDVSGGNINWFPDTTGGSVSDNAILELSNNFLISISCYINTTSGASKDIVFKDSAFYIYVSNTTTGNITAEIQGAGWNIAATGISDGYHNIQVYADTVNMTIAVDGVVKDTRALGGASVPNNAFSWLFCESGSTPYVNTINITTGGVQRANWQWQYAATFTDTINSIVLTPSFRTTSDSGITASIISQSGLITSTTPTGNVTGGWTMIGTLPAEPSRLFTEDAGNWSIFGFDFGTKINAAATAADQSTSAWQILFAFGVIVGLMILAYKGTQSIRMGRRGSLIICSIIGGFGLVIFIYIAKVVPGFVLIPYGLFALLLVSWRTSRAPVD